MINAQVRTVYSRLFSVLVIFSATAMAPAQQESTTPPPENTQPKAAGEDTPEEEQQETAKEEDRPQAQQEEIFQEEAEAPTLEEVVITATRRSEPAFDVPYTVESLSFKDIFQNQYRTTPEALRRVPGVMIQKTSHGQGSPYLRGFTGFHNLFLIDGIRLNHSVFRSGNNQYWNTVDPLTIDRLEVVKGPSSVLYGSDAIGGTVNAITKSPTGYGEGFSLRQRLYSRYSTAERSIIGRYEVNATLDDKLGFIFGISGKDFGSLQGGNDVGRQPNTGYDEYDINFKLEYWINPDTRIVAAHQRVRQNNVPRTHRTIFAKSFDGTTIGRDLRRELDQERHLTYIQLHAENMDSFIETMRLSVSWQEQAEVRDRIRSNRRRDLQGFRVGTFGVWAQFESPTAIGHLTYGFDYYRDHLNSFSTRNFIQGPVADEASYDLLGIYLQDEIELTDSLDLVLGGRFSYVQADASRVRNPRTGLPITVSEDWSSVVGSAKLVYHLVPEHINLYGGVSQGFRAPNFSDMTRFDISRTDEIETPAFGLDPEFFVSYELGFKAEYDDFSLQAAYFYTRIKDMITRVPTGRVIEDEFEVTKINAGDGYVQGFELGASYRFHPDWTAFGSFAWVDGEVGTFPISRPVKEREPLSNLMPVTGEVGLHWDHPSRKFWVEGIAILTDRADDLSTRDIRNTSRIPPGGTPGYSVFSVWCGWQITDDVNFTFAVENITDEDYRVHGSGQNEPGRNFVFGLEINL